MCIIWACKGLNLERKFGTFPSKQGSLTNEIKSIGSPDDCESIVSKPNRGWYYHSFEKICKTIPSDFGAFYSEGVPTYVNEREFYCVEKPRNKQVLD